MNCPALVRLKNDVDVLHLLFVRVVVLVRQFVQLLVQLTMCRVLLLVDYLVVRDANILVLMRS